MSDSQVFQQIKNLVIEATKRGASDLHLSVGNVPIARINGWLRMLDKENVLTTDFIQSVVELLLDKEQKEILSQKKEIIITYDLDKSLRFKVNIYYQKGTLSVVFRYIPTAIPSLDKLGFDQELKVLTGLSDGLVLLAGPYGSGRSTTAAALIENINKTQKKYIITAEDPIEHIFTNKQSIIEQRQVGRDVLSVKAALEYFQEEDGDVFYAEELKDDKSILAALEIACGSGMVITSLFASSAVTAVEIIIERFQATDRQRIRDMLAKGLRMVICQKLIPKIGGGLELVAEIMIVNDAVRSTIRSGNLSQLENIISTSRKEGMISFDQALAIKINKGLISMETAMPKASNSGKLRQLIK